jgi:hypothetical protein
LRRGAAGPARPAVVGIDASLAAGLIAGGGVARRKTLGYTRAELALSRTRRPAGGRNVQFLRAYAAYAERAPRERQIYASASDPTTTFTNHFWRPRGGPLAPSVRFAELPCCDGASGTYRTLADGHYRPLGGAALRGYSPLLALGSVVAVNAEQARLLRTLGAGGVGPKLYASLFADVGMPLVTEDVESKLLLGDAGVGLSVRGALFDRDVRVRADFPLYVRAPSRALDAGGRETRFRFAFSFNDLW